MLSGSWVARYGQEAARTGCLGRKTRASLTNLFDSAEHIKPCDVRYRDQKSIYSE